MYLRASSAAALLDLPLSTFRQLVREGKLPGAVSQIGKHWLWSREQLVAAVDPRGYKAAHEHQATAGRPPASAPEREGQVRVPAGSRDGRSRASDQATRRSPYAGILGRHIGRPGERWPSADADPDC